MNRRGTIGSLVALLILALPGAVAFAAGAAQGQPPDGDRVVVGDSAVVAGGETVDGSVVVVGGEFFVDEGGQVTGDVVVVGGSLELGGRVGGDVVTVGAALEIGDGAQVEGETVAVGGAAEVDEDASLTGGFYQTPGPDLTGVSLSSLSSLPRLLGPALGPRREGTSLADWAWRLGGVLNWAVIAGLLAALVLLAWPVPLSRIGRAVNRAPITAGGVGCLSMLVFPLLAALFAVTLVLIPLTILVALAFVAVLLFGWVAVGVLFGERLLEWLGTRNITARSAGIAGTFALTLLLGVIGTLPRLGWLGALSALLLATLGAGAVVLTRFGWQAYHPLPVAAGAERSDVATAGGGASEGRVDDAGP